MICLFQLATCLQLMTGLCSVLVLCALSFIPVIKQNKPNPDSQQEQSKLKRIIGSLVYLPNWRNKRFVVWTLAIPLALFGYFVPYVHLPMFAKEIPLDQDEQRNGEKASQLIMCIGVSSGLGRLISGFLADLPMIKRDGNRILLQQISFVSIGICTMLLTLAQMFGENVFLVSQHLAGSHRHNSLSLFQALLTFCFILGIFDGCFITMLGPIAFDLCGPAGAGQAIGFLLALCSIPLTVGPPVAGYIYDTLGNYSPAFLAAGFPPIVGAVAMFSIRCLKSREEGDTTKPITSSETRDTVVPDA